MMCEERADRQVESVALVRKGVDGEVRGKGAGCGEVKGQKGGH